MSHSPPVWTGVSAIGTRSLPAWEIKCTLWGNLCFYLHYHREDVWRWDGKPTSVLAALVCELRGSTTTAGNSSRINPAPFTVSPQTGGLMLLSMLLKGYPAHIYRKWAMTAVTRTRRALSLVRWGKGIIGCIGLWVQCPGAWDPKSMRL